ncbi:hypothetical protein [Streptomyces synnematoformans]|uniref:Uncharacterized protein n=1 Tax=Streptomyces synnematoformans TaxID=415721 RepID=A0ABN2YPR1_9ACTN
MSCFGFFVILVFTWVIGYGLGGGWPWGFAAAGLLLVLLPLYRHRYLLGSHRALSAHLRSYGSSSLGMKVRWVRIEAVTGLDTRGRRQSHVTYDEIDGVPLTLLARLLRRRLVAVVEGDRLTLWHRRLGRYHEVARLHPRTLRVQNMDRDFLLHNSVFLAESFLPAQEHYSMIADFGDDKTVSFHVRYGQM